MTKCIADFSLVFVVLIFGGLTVQTLRMIVKELQKLNKTMMPEKENKIPSFLRRN